MGGRRLEGGGRRREIVRLMGETREREREERGEGSEEGRLEGGGE